MIAKLCQFEALIALKPKLFKTREVYYKKNSNEMASTGITSKALKPYCRVGKLVLTVLAI